MSELQVQRVTKAYGANPVLTDLDLTVTHGSITALLGPSGSGKTTLLRLVAGFDQIDHGVIRIGDAIVDDGHRRQPPERRHLGYVPQDGALFPHLTVAANVGFGLSRAHRHSPKVGELLEMVGLSGLERRYPDQLSGGQQQRVALARALAVDPELVLLDEPFSALDPTLRASIRLDVLAILRAAKATAILVTHDQDEALSAADDVAVIHGGVVVQHAPPAELYAAPVDAGLARFLGQANFFDTVISGGCADTPLGRLAVAGRDLTPSSSGPATVMLRPEQLDVQSQPRTGEPPPAAGAVAVAGTVVQAEFHGHSTVLAIALTDAPDHSPVLALVQAAVAPTLGASVAVVVTGPAMAWLGEPTPAW